MKRKVFIFSVLALLVAFAAACGGTNETADADANADTDAEANENAESNANENSNGDGEEQAEGSEVEDKEALKLGITQIVEHPSLDSAREGFLEALADNGYVEGENLEVDVQFAQEDMSTNSSIAQQFATGDYDLILAVSTPSAQAVVTQVRDAGKETPIFFTAITDPVDAELIDSFESPGANVTGTSDAHPDAIPYTMQAVTELFPDAENVGVLYNAGEDNSVADVEVAKEAVEELGLELVEKTAQDSSAVTSAAQSLIGEADVIFIPKDNTVISSLEAVGSVAQENDIPVFVNEGDSVERAGGGFYAYGFKYADIGYQTGEMAIRVVDGGENPGEIAAERPAILDLYVNYENAAAQGIDNLEEMIEDLPEELRQRVVEYNK